MSFSYKIGLIFYKLTIFFLSGKHLLKKQGISERSKRVESTILAYLVEVESLFRNVIMAELIYQIQKTE
jgi:hypothetical protein